MIGRLRGTLAAKQPPWLVLDVGGVGYEIQAPMSTIFDLPETGKEVTLLTHYAVKEDTVALYGFLRESERVLFRTLQKVSGIGAKISLAVLSGVSVDEFARLVQSGDIAALTRVPGIGKKTAERIVVELRDRVDGIAMTVPGFSESKVPPRCRVRSHRGACSSWVTSRSNRCVWSRKPRNPATMRRRLSAKR